jgi:hypothetical protein
MELKLGVVMYACNPRLRQEISKFEASLSYIPRPCLKIIKQEKWNYRNAI